MRIMVTLVEVTVYPSEADCSSAVGLGPYLEYAAKGKSLDGKKSNGGGMSIGRYTKDGGYRSVGLRHLSRDSARAHGCPAVNLSAASGLRGSPPL